MVIAIIVAVIACPIFTTKLPSADGGVVVNLPAVSALRK
jgi:hypothetical protein